MCPKTTLNAPNARRLSKPLKYTRELSFKKLQLYTNGYTYLKNLRCNYVFPFKVDIEIVLAYDLQKVIAT